MSAIPGEGVVRRPLYAAGRRREDVVERLFDGHGLGWDLIAGSELDGLWYACRAALRLTKQHGSPVRLFADPQLLARLLPALDAHREEQWWQGIHVLAARKLHEVLPAPMALQVFDAALPPGYLERRWRHGVGGELLRLERLAEGLAGAEPLHCLHQGGPFFGAGFVKPSPNAYDLRCTLRESPAGRVATVRRARLSRDARPGERTILVSAPVVGSAWREWIAAWRRSEVPLRVLVLDGLGRGPALAREMRRSRELEDGPLSLALVDGCNWSLGDDLLWLSDLVLTSDEDFVMRAMASATPVLFAAPEARQDRSGAASAKVVGWQLRARPASEALRGAMATLGLAWQSGRHIAESWQRFSAVWDEAQRCAAATACWLQTMPDAIDTAAALARRRMVDQGEAAGAAGAVSIASSR